MNKEIWKDIEGFERMYQISSYGRIRSLDRMIMVEGKFPKKINGRMMIAKKSYWYPKVSLCKEGKCKVHLIHRLVANAFIPNPENKEYVNHKDGNKSNNDVLNLEWSTAKENTNHAWEMGLSKPSNANKNGNRQGEKIQTAVLSEEDVIFIRQNAKRNGGSISNVELAKKFAVTSDNIQRILRYKTWKHVGGPKGKNNRQAISNTGFENVYSIGNRFQGWFNKNKKRYHCGSYMTPLEAHRAVVNKRKELEGTE